jgi:hypothetical protein
VDRLGVTRSEACSGVRAVSFSSFVPPMQVVKIDSNECAVN